MRTFTPEVTHTYFCSHSIDENQARDPTKMQWSLKGNPIPSKKLPPTNSSISRVGNYILGPKPACCLSLCGLQAKNAFYILKQLLNMQLQYILSFTCWPTKHQTFAIWNMTQQFADSCLPYGENTDLGFSVLLIYKVLHVDFFPHGEDIFFCERTTVQ